MAKEKKSEYELSDQEKDDLHDMVNEFARKLTDVRGGNYSGDRLLAALQFIILEIENLEPMLYHDLATGYDEDELEENTTGGGAAFNAGAGMGHFGNNSNKKRKIKFAEQEDMDNLRKDLGINSDPEIDTTDHLGKDGELEQDSERIINLLDRINTGEEFIEIFHSLLNHGKENIPQITVSVTREILRDALKDI